jgi:3-oxoacyl-[acyl-carrier protein] reductase
VRSKQYTARSTPLGRIGNPEDVAGAILMLASDQARFVTGTYLPVNGGAFML